MTAERVPLNEKVYGVDYIPEKINGDYEGKHILSVEQFERRDLEELFKVTTWIRHKVKSGDPSVNSVALGKVMASLFYEPSTRTDLSFQAAMRRLGGNVINASNGVQFSSVYKGENLPDTIRAVGCYADAIILRHPEAGSTFEAAHALEALRSETGTETILISGGDGIGEHPTQALLDLYTIEDFKGNSGDIDITLVGDLFNGRTVHSLGRLLSINGFGRVRVNLVSPESLRMPAEIISSMEEKGISVLETERLNNVLSSTDVIYWTRVQEERFEDPSEYAAIKDSFVLTPELMTHVKSDAIVMHPLPRKGEMGSQYDHKELDQDPRTVYFQQMENGMYIRMALLGATMGRIRS